MNKTVNFVLLDVTGILILYLFGTSEQDVFPYWAVEIFVEPQHELGPAVDRQSSSQLSNDFQPTLK